MILGRGPRVIRGIKLRLWEFRPRVRGTISGELGGEKRIAGSGIQVVYSGSTRLGKN